MGMREISPFGIRMPPDLKDALLREATAAGRSMNQELILRLRASLENPVSEPTVTGYTVQSPSMNYSDTITDIERQLLYVFRRLPPEKQLALLSLFR